MVKIDCHNGWFKGLGDIVCFAWIGQAMIAAGHEIEFFAQGWRADVLRMFQMPVSDLEAGAITTHHGYEEAIEQLRRTAELEPNYPVTYWILGLSLRKMGRHDLAVTEGEKGVKLSGGSPLMRAALAHSLGAAGRKEEAFQMFDDLTKLAKQKYVSPYFLAGIQVGLGENDRAIEYLEKSYEEHSHWLIYLHIDPSMDGLKGDPRFQDLLRRVGLPQLTITR